MRRGSVSSVREARITIESDIAELARVTRLAQQLLESQHASERLVYATELALEEVLTNIIRHGYLSESTHRIDLWLRVGSGGVEIEIEDDGREFDPTTAADAELHLPLAERPIGGLGIHLLRAYAREMSYERRAGRNLLRLRI